MPADTCGASLLDAGIESEVRATSAELMDAFGVAFDFWRKDDDWTHVYPQPAPSGEFESNQRPNPELRVVLEGVLESKGQAEVVGQTDGCHLVVIPVHAAGQVAFVATARFSAPPEELIKKLIRVVFRTIAEKQQHCDEIDSYATQISDNFEVLTYLHRLAEQMECSDSGGDVWELARTTLPLLQSLVRAEALVLLPAAAGQKSAGENEGHVKKPPIWVGPRIIDNEACWQIVENFRHIASLQPMVSNEFHKTKMGASCPAIERIVMVSLARGELVLGWLLALNRLDVKVEESSGPERALSEEEFGTVEVSLIHSAASMLATHARNLELFREREALLVNMVRAMVSAIDAKDPYTCGHSERVALVARELGRELGLNEQELEELYLTGLLHDVGKIGVSDQVLQKPGKLTAEEFEEIKKHPDLGYAILRDLEQISYVLPGVLYHHESLDGTGYPDRLTGENIPFWARILAVADSFDAMSSDRPYRKGMPDQKVESVLHDGAGTQWDATIVETFFWILPNIRKLVQSYQPRSLPMRSRQNAPEGG